MSYGPLVGAAGDLTWLRRPRERSATVTADPRTVPREAAEMPAHTVRRGWCRSPNLMKFTCKIEIGRGEASPAAQRCRICLPIQETRVRSLVREDPTCWGRHNYRGSALELGSSNYKARLPRSLWPAARGAAAVRSRQAAMEGGLALHSWRKVLQQRRPSTAKNKQIDKSFKRNQVKKIRPFSPPKQEWTSENTESMSDKRGKLRHRGWPV